MCTVRKYKESDKDALRFICIQTAGDSFRKNEKTLEAVSVIYSDYFTENESDNIFVLADGNDTAVGYILCSCDYDKFRKQMIKRYIPRAVKKSRGMLPACMGYLTAHFINGRKNSVHLHIDILPEYQHMGFGTKLIDALRKYLFEKNIERLCVNTIDVASAPYKFYKKYGFDKCRHIFGNIYSLSIKTDCR